MLKKSPPGLTTLAIVRAHGERDMPAWGDRYSSDAVKAAEYYMDVPYDAEMFARSRILSLIDYLNRIQVK